MVVKGTSTSQKLGSSRTSLTSGPLSNPLWSCPATDLQVQFLSHCHEGLSGVEILSSKGVSQSRLVGILETRKSRGCLKMEIRKEFCCFSDH